MAAPEHAVGFTWEKYCAQLIVSSDRWLHLSNPKTAQKYLLHALLHGDFKNNVKRRCT